MMAGFGVVAFMVLRREWSKTLAPGPKESVVMSVMHAWWGCARLAVGVDMGVEKEGGT